MSLYGINAYTSNSYYSSLLAGKNNSSLLNSMASNKLKGNSNNLSDMLTNALKTDPNDLYGLAKKVQMLRSPSYQKELLEGFKEYFSGGAADSDTEKNENESAEKLSASAKSLSEYAGQLATNGNQIFEDPDKTVSAVKNFVDSYNSTLDGLKNSNSSKILQKGVTLVGAANAYSRTLKRVGVTVDSDNRLSLDEDKLKASSPLTLKSLFTGSYSLAHKIADKASYISRAVSLESQLSYNSKGNKTDWLNQYFANSIFNSKV